jgi:predicted nucleotidyltransferase
MISESPATEARRLAKQIIRRFLPDPSYRIFLFGSRASGKAHARSDIDIGIEGPVAVPYETLASIIEELEESPTLFSFDVVDFKRVPEQFREVAMAGNREAL